jgi:tetratricopeptide (TPR) repeat protein
VAVYQRERRLGLEARETLAAFQTDSRRFQLSFTGLPEDERRSLDAAVLNGRQALSHYPAPDDPAWNSAPAIRHLRPADRQLLREEVGVILLMLAHATANGTDDPPTLEEALRLNEQAARCFPAGEIPAAFFTQQAELLEHLGRAPEAEAVRRLAVPSPGGSARDLYLAGWEHARSGRFAKAVPPLEEAAHKDPQALWAWFLLGRSYDGLGRDADAVAAYGACLALQPDAHQVWFQRGLAYLRRGDFRNARADFDRVVELKPDVADAYFNRALAKKELHDYAGAEADLTKALEVGSAFTRIYFVRAQVRAKLGDKAGAERDRREGFAREPADESSLTARGFARLSSDPKGALADFDRALKLNAQYLPALHNKAAVLADRLNRPADAVAVLDQAIRHHPEQAVLWAGRAVYLARLGRRADAHTDAEEALQRSGAPAIRYQVAGVYALTSREHPEDRPEALRLLAAALRKDYGFEFLDTDPELAPVRDLPEFKELVAAARALRDRR